jgi:hypothetical protein
MGGDSGPTPKRPSEALALIPWHADAAVFSGCSILSAFSVVPVVMAVDKSVTQAAAGMPLSQALKTVGRDMITRPIAVLRSAPFWMVMGVYGCTYGANNLVDVASERFALVPATVTSMKLVGVTGAYTATSILKDVAFAKMFSKAADSAKEVKRSVPASVYGTFLFRDALIIGAGFILPAMVASAIKSNTKMEPKRADKVAQLGTPCAMQIIITPIHLFGLNLYNAPTATVGERMRAIMSTYPQTTGVRMFRFFWAYGVGGLMNKELNQNAREWTVGRYAS